MDHLGSAAHASGQQDQPDVPDHMINFDRVFFAAAAALPTPPPSPPPPAAPQVGSVKTSTLRLSDRQSALLRSEVMGLASDARAHAQAYGRAQPPPSAAYPAVLAAAASAPLKGSSASGRDVHTRRDLQAATSCGEAAASSSKHFQLFPGLPERLGVTMADLELMIREQHQQQQHQRQEQGQGQGQGQGQQHLPQQKQQQQQPQVQHQQQQAASARAETAAVAAELAAAAAEAEPVAATRPPLPPPAAAACEAPAPADGRASLPLADKDGPAAPPADGLELPGAGAGASSQADEEEEEQEPDASKASKAKRPRKQWQLSGAWPPPDGYLWRKYGQKSLAHFEGCTRMYFWCANRKLGCQAKKTMDLYADQASEVATTTTTANNNTKVHYEGVHNHIMHAAASSIRSQPRSPLASEEALPPLLSSSAELAPPWPSPLPSPLAWDQQQQQQQQEGQTTPPFSTSQWAIGEGRGSGSRSGSGAVAAMSSPPSPQPTPTVGAAPSAELDRYPSVASIVLAPATDLPFSPAADTAPATAPAGDAPQLQFGSTSRRRRRRRRQGRGSRGAGETCGGPSMSSGSEGEEEDAGPCEGRGIKTHRYSSTNSTVVADHADGHQSTRALEELSVGDRERDESWAEVDLQAVLESYRVRGGGIDRK